MRQWERKRPGEPMPVDEAGHPLLPFDVDPEAVEALDPPGTAEEDDLPPPFDGDRDPYRDAADDGPPPDGARADADGGARRGDQ